ncbi:hypothetical protein NEMIN01_1270 [Nematocida minor]|uniref:uncharacterized protein n=1 Tax=Nematocida minor TaxID=1912983 RepID=UPI00221E7825|nr:uncharacterized protein NEMIN01_1270 [Nematocida minor]KAI5190937.1 hypothetical protein NEMIN01_1270 [Nematocida minor]
MKELSDFIHSSVCVTTYCDNVYHGTLLAVDQYLNVVLQSVLKDNNEKKGFIFIKGSNILLLNLLQ